MVAPHHNAESDTAQAIDLTEQIEHGPWNPGLRSELAPELCALCTIFRPENTFTSYADAVELQDLTGLPLPDLVAFRPERMALHEVLVQVIADFEVPDPEGASVPSLGINFRRMTKTLLTQYVEPRMAEIAAVYEPIKSAINRIAQDELRTAFDRFPTSQPSPRRFGRLNWLRRKSTPAASIDDHDSERDRQLIETWASKARTTDPMVATTYSTLARVLGAVESKHGRLWGDRDMLASLVTGLACNVHASESIGQLIEPLVRAAAKAEGYRRLPPQQRSIVLSTKGASASGKSTMRPLQRALARRLGVRWSDFALISPDIFRRDLIDIDSLGVHFKYFAAVTSHENEVVDRKLDRRLSRKVEQHGTPHMLVDRFRFDSFVADSEEHRQLLSRLDELELIHYIFMITPPHQTVERAWQRGLRIGRYKAVDDLLGHNIEAYSGMQRFFFARALQPDKFNRHYEFLDNDVPPGEVPLTVAFGWNGALNILDVSRILDLDRYQKIDVNARSAADVYPGPVAMSAANNLSFFRECVERFPALQLAERRTCRIYARIEYGRLVWRDGEVCDALSDADTVAALRLVIPELMEGLAEEPAREPEFLDPAKFLTLGCWGRGAGSPTTSA